jgi:uncharacterized repeat protein (TIGR01451 family)
MARCKLFNLALIISSSLGLLIALIALSQAAPAVAATRVTTLHGAGASPGVEGISQAAGGPGLVQPPSLPRTVPMLQDGPVLTMTKSADPTPVNAGEVLSYAIVVVNSGDASATGVVITDPLGSGVSFAGASDGGSYDSGVVTWDVGMIGIGETVTRTLWVTVGSYVAGGTNLSNTAWVTSTEGIGDSDTIATKVTTAADLQIAKSHSGNPVVAGTSFAYYITVTNNGPSDASGVTVTDALPLGLTFNASGSSAQCSASGQNVTCYIGDLLADDEVTLTIAVSADAALAEWATLTNTASVFGAERDPDSGNDLAQEETTVVRRTDLQAAKSASRDQVEPGTSFTYSITVTNNGPSVATGIEVSDALPAGLAFDTAGSSPDCLASGQDVTCTIGALSVAGEETLTVAVTADTSLENGLMLSNTASVSGNEPDPNQDNNSATEEVIVERSRVFLPILLKPVLAELYVFNDNTGDDVTFVVLGTSVSCVVPDNTTEFCGNFLPGTYQVQVSSACGDGSFTKTYGGGPVTTRVFCR